MSIREKVLAFHNAMKLPIQPWPQVPKDDRVRLRARLITEEYFEVMASLFGTSSFLEASNIVGDIIDDQAVSVDMLELADGLTDLDYVVEGTRIEFGIDGEPVLEEVQRANMAKVGGPVRTDGKIGKPEGWTPPDIHTVLWRQGWRSVPTTADGLRTELKLEREDHAETRRQLAEARAELAVERAQRE